ncbi:MAG: TlpA family protein disulfide reductase [Hydrogenophaga sp.]|uniref:TlpA disulfide reductase family protein n=1 Tax=Hydrogenophaga sp. TaxID=1904254 RepID=UPI001D7D2726|nr:TlpA disulfide reductase family protein [Hydrogenophaga sp.]MBX3610667.1 TlpA family protein disulfide reductase [Hydrogenophaga sp.]
MKLQRRHWLAGGVAVGAAAAGAWWAQRHFRLEAVTTEAERKFWATSFDAPDGHPVPMQPMLGRPLLVNFWATWCPPCVEELPLLNAFHARQQGQGWQLLGLAVDRVEAVQAFLKKLPIAFPVAMTGFAGTDLSRELGNPSGGLPFSVLFGRDGRVVQRKIGQLKPADLDHWATLA